MYKLTKLLFIIVLSLSISCSSDDDVTEPQDTQTVYIAGYERVNNIRYPRLWKNGMMSPLGENNKEGIANQVYIDGADVYVVGAERNAAGIYVAKYWKNGNEVNLTNGSQNSIAYCIKKVNNLIVVGGYSMYNGVTSATIWQNGIQRRIDNSNNISYVNSIEIFSENGVVAFGEILDTQSNIVRGVFYNIPLNNNNIEGGYLANSNTYLRISGAKLISELDRYIYYGSEKNANGKEVAYYSGQVLQTRNYITDGGYDAKATDLAYHNNILYFSGYEKNANNINVAKYWKDNSSINLSDGTKDAYASGIAVSNNDVYVCGHEDSKAVFWKNGAKTQLANDTSEANSVIVVNN